MNRAVIFIVALLASSYSFSDSASGEFMAYGLGSVSCGKYSSLSKNGSGHDMANQWVLGFVTAKNESLHFEKVNSYLEGLDTQAITKYIENYCGTNPLDQLYSAANRLVYDLSLKN
ncbi:MULTISPECIES: hypothetical protein [unclassified Shewanella]|jgi:hypothetical protein|uniref:hypothetical protein n=1 Tax=unclassified Shewanella TaxID=196818 RepID=UPI00137C0B21|nr:MULTISPECIES: hypothetical protein [unclassified Shewanella]MBB1361835.1 hypothetical protein [Shewanella sp. SR44-4]QHS14990.1 hypothetical protein GUY17_18710 [Shewanella sp. Arc9-LZ]